MIFVTPCAATRLTPDPDSGGPSERSARWLGEKRQHSVSDRCCPSFALVVSELTHVQRLARRIARRACVLQQLRAGEPKSTDVVGVKVN